MAIAVAAVTGLVLLAGAVLGLRRWRDRDRQARSVTAWVVREEVAAHGAADLHGVLLHNAGAAPVTQVGLRVRETGGAWSAQLFAGLEPGRWFVQRSDDPERPWSALHPAEPDDDHASVALGREVVRLTPAPSGTLSLDYVGFRDARGRLWWRIDDGRLTDRPPYGWNLAALRRTTQRRLDPPRRPGCDVGRG